MTSPVSSLCAFPAGVILWEAEPGQLSLTVIVKATFALVPGEAVVAPAQDPLCEPRHWDDNGLASLHGPGDFAPSKRRVDVTLAGHAYAPRGEPVTSLVARLAVGDFVKAVRVTGDRVWTLGAGDVPEAGPPSPFLRLPLRYERAALSADNPIGIDANAPPVLGAPALPNLEPDGSRDQGTACFGPVAPTWRARRRLLDDEARRDGAASGPKPRPPAEAMFWAYGIARDPRAPTSEHAPPIGPAPPRFDFAFFNAAPADQQIDLLRPGTPISLAHLHPRHELLETRLPAVRPQVFRVPPSDTPRARVEEIALRCDSLWIDTDRAVAVVTWRGLTDVGPRSADVGRIVVAADPQGKKLRWDQVEKRLGEQGLPTLRLGPGGLPLPEEPDTAPPPDLLARRHDSVKGKAPLPESDAVSPVDTRGTPESPDSTAWDAPTNALDAPVTTEPPVSKPVLAPAPQTPGGQRPAVEVDVDTYARLQLAVERGEVGGMLADLQLSLGDLVRIQGAWARRAAASPRLAAQLARALEAARAR